MKCIRCTIEAGYCRNVCRLCVNLLGMTMRYQWARERGLGTDNDEEWPFNQDTMPDGSQWLQQYRAGVFTRFTCIKEPTHE